MATQFPGFSISVLQQQTFARRTQPVTISGRVTAFGLGVPALVRVFLEGPAHNPEVRSFDTLAAPLTGDYAVPVLAEKDGQYQVYAQAFPPLGIPLPGSPVLLAPPLAESPRPPLAIGEPVNGELEQELAPGQRQRISPPVPTPVEISAPITFAPTIEIPVTPTTAPAALPIVATLPGPPEAPAAVTVAPQLGGRIAGFEIEE